MKAILFDVAPKQATQRELDDRMAELESLVSTYGWIVVIRRLQKRDQPDYHTYIGSGKIDEICALAEETGADTLIIGNILKSAQTYHIDEVFQWKKLKIRTWDRVDLILKIFQLHANSPESKLQIELASIRHMWPRIFGMGMELSRQGWSGGGWGGGARRWLGETNTEIMKRHLRNQEQKIIEKLKTYEKTREEHRKHRKRMGYKTIGIVGYTNAWKSSLMNALTKKGVLAEDKLFATLGTSVGKLWIPTENGRGEEYLLNDTIGFIRDLPPELVQAFSSTLEDSIESDCLFHVVDASDPKMGEKIEVVNDTLDRIGAKQERIFVFNKSDAASDESLAAIRSAHPDALVVSAFSGAWLDGLRQWIPRHFWPGEKSGDN